MPLFGNSSDIVGDIAQIFLDSKNETTTQILAKIKERFPYLTHGERIRVLRQVNEVIA